MRRHRGAGAAWLVVLALSGCEGPFQHKLEQLRPCWPRCSDGAPVDPVCAVDADCDDGDPCTQDACRTGACIRVPLDADADGSVSSLCGGDDCDDARRDVHPGAAEGPPGSPDCGDGVDNDCDGAVDLVEQACLTGVCDEHGWCWISPRPSGAWLAGVWMASPDEIWTVGTAGTIVRSDGVRFAQTPTGTRLHLRAIWGARSDAIWAVGEDGLILHWDGSGWTQQDSGNTTHDLQGVYGTSSTDVWAVGAAGLVLHWDGVSWSSVSSGTNEALWSVWAASPTEAWFAGDGSTLLRWDGVATQPFSCGLATSFTSIHGVAPDQVWAVGPGAANVFCLWDGQAWSVRSESLGARVVHGTTPASAWAFGLDGRMVRWDGSAWSIYFESPVPTLEHLFAASSVAEDDVWAVGSNGEMIHWNGLAWTRLRPELPESQDFSDVWGCAPDDVWVAGGSAVFHYDGEALTSRAPAVDAFRGFGCDDIWGVNFLGTASHWDGSAWTSEASGAAQVTSIGGTRSDDLWLVTQTAEVWHRDVAGWSLAHTAREPLFDVFAVAEDEVWIVGLNGFLARYDGSQWVELTGPTVADLQAVWASAPDDVWALGRAAAWRWDGAQWSVVPGLPSDWAGIGAGATSIDGRGADDVWLVNAGGLIAHWDGATWTELPAGVAQDLVAVFASPWGEVWLAGRGSTALRRAP